MKITDVRAIQILDSRGNPTIRTFITLDDETYASASVPSGASTGAHEAVELRDNDKSLYHGKSVNKAIEHVNTTIKKAILNKEVSEVAEIDRTMINLDGTDNKSHLGANAILSVSQAVVRAVAKSNKLPLWKFINKYYFPDTSPKFPKLMVNVVNGGRHADWRFDIQEFMIIPRPSFPSHAIRIASEIFIELGKLLKSEGFSTLVGNEGGYSPALNSNQEVFEKIIQAANRLSYKEGIEFSLGMDVAASEFYKNGTYVLSKDKKELKGEELSNYYMDLVAKYKLSLIEDPFSEDDWKNFSKFTQRAGKYLTIIGDDLYVTNKTRINKGIELRASNAALIKLNQIGSVLETVEAIKTARDGHMKISVSHRSGETCDSFIADLAYATASDFIKTGSMSRSERLAKYNRLLEIESNVK